MRKTNVFAFLAPVTKLKSFRDGEYMNVAFDAFEWVKARYNTMEVNLVNFKNEEILSHLVKDIEKLSKLLTKMIFVFDGEIMNSRKKKLSDLKSSSIMGIDDAYEYKNKGYTNIFLGEMKKYFIPSIELMELLFDKLKSKSFEVIKAPYDSVAYLSALVNNGTIDMAFTDDPSIHLFQPSVVGFHFLNDYTYSCVSLSDILEFYSLKKKQLTELLCISGQGLIKTPSFLGLTGFLKLFQKGNTLEETIKSLSLPKEFISNLNKEISEIEFRKNKLEVVEQSSLLEKNSSPIKEKIQLDLFGNECISSPSKKKKKTAPHQQSNTLVSYFKEEN